MVAREGSENKRVHAIGVDWGKRHKSNHYHNHWNLILQLINKETFIGYVCLCWVGLWTCQGRWPVGTGPKEEISSSTSQKNSTIK